MEHSLLLAAKDFLLVCIYPIVLFVGKAVHKKFKELDIHVSDHKTRIAVTESQVKTINDDIREIKDSIDKLPGRIKSDIKDLLKNG